MTLDAPSWSVVTTVDEPPALVQTFVAWHLSLGAERVFVYCDRPDDPVADILAHLPQVQVVLCDDAHWQRLGKSRPRRHQVRQVRNARDAYRHCTSDWLLHVDADEYLWSRKGVAPLLSAIEPDADVVIVQVAERMHRPDDPDTSIFEGVFRRPFRKPSKMGERIFGPDYALTYRGLTGHAHGKTFVRTGRQAEMSIHRPQPAKGHPELIKSRPAPEAIELLHFDGLTPTYWIYKLARMQRALDKADGMPPSQHRRAQADALLADPDGGQDLYRRLKHVTPNIAQRLEKHGLLFVPAFDPSAALATSFQGTAVDLTPAAMDAWLAAKKPQVVPYLWKAAKGD